MSQENKRIHVLMQKVHRFSAALLLGFGAQAAMAVETPVTGLNIGSEVADIFAKSPDPTTAINTYMAGVAATNVRWVRLGINWESTQRNQSTINVNDPNPGASSGLTWTKSDIVIRAARNNNLRVLGLITLTPRWAVSSKCPADHLTSTGAFWLCAPDPTAYAAFAEAAAKHYSSDSYGGKVDAWEIWNEPNCAGEFIPHDPAIYTQMMIKSYPLIKRVNPAAIVLAGGTAGCATSPMSANGTLPAGGILTLQNAPTSANPAPITWDSRDWLVAMYANGARGYFDHLAHHPYCYSNDWQGLGKLCPETASPPAGDWSPFVRMWYDFTSPSYGWPGANGVKPLQSYYGTSLRTILNNNSDNAKSIYFTEFGAPTIGTETNLTTSALTRANQDREYKALMTWVSQQPYGQYGPVFAFCFSDMKEGLFDVDPKELYFGLVALGATTGIDGTPGAPKDAYKTWRDFGTTARTGAFYHALFPSFKQPFGW